MPRSSKCPTPSKTTNEIYTFTVRDVLVVLNTKNQPEQAAAIIVQIWLGNIDSHIADLMRCDQISFRCTEEEAMGVLSILVWGYIANRDSFTSLDLVTASYNLVLSELLENHEELVEYKRVRKQFKIADINLLCHINLGFKLFSACMLDFTTPKLTKRSSDYIDIFKRALL